MATGADVFERQESKTAPGADPATQHRHVRGRLGSPATVRRCGLVWRWGQPRLRLVNQDDVECTIARRGLVEVLYVQIEDIAIWFVAILA